MANESTEAESTLPDPCDIMNDDITLKSATLLSNWRTSLEAGTLNKHHIVDYFQKQSRQYFEYQSERPGMSKAHFY